MVCALLVSVVIVLAMAVTVMMTATAQEPGACDIDGEATTQAIGIASAK